MKNKQKSNEHETLKKTFEAFNNELLADIDTFFEQRHDAFDSAFIAVSFLLLFVNKYFECEFYKLIKKNIYF